MARGHSRFYRLNVSRLVSAKCQASVGSRVRLLFGAEDRCYRSLREGLLPPLQAMVPDLRFIDCSRLSGLERPPLKELADQIAEKDWTLRKLSQQKIADALRAFGMRVPKSRPRVN